MKENRAIFGKASSILMADEGRLGRSPHRISSGRPYQDRRTWSPCLEADDRSGVVNAG
jgi:hypothetical protein